MTIANADPDELVKIVRGAQGSFEADEFTPALNDRLANFILWRFKAIYGSAEATHG